MSKKSTHGKIDSVENDSDKQTLLQEMLEEIEKLLLTDQLSEEQKGSVLRKIMNDHKEKEEVSK